jgi:hypothetical protein
VKPFRPAAWAAILGASLGAGPTSPGAGIQVLHSGEVSTDEPTARHVESVLAVNPRDSRNRIAAAMVLETGERVGVYASRDSGGTWTRATWGPQRRTHFDGLDPAVAFASDGSAYFLSVGTDLLVWKSTDGGFHWENPVVVPGRAWDRPWIACAPGRIYVSGKLPVTVFGHLAQDIVGLSSSEDGGRTFRSPRLFLPNPDQDLLNVVSDLLVLGDGNPLLALQLFSPDHLKDGIPAGNYATALSRDGGRSITAPSSGPPFRVYGHAWEGKSLYGLGGGRLAIDASGGPRDGRLYLVWTDASDSIYRVAVSSSADSGATWSDPVLVSDPSTEADASTPAVAVDGRGSVAVVWYDRRADPGNGCYQLYAAVSRDGGVSFSISEPLDAARTCPLAEGAAVASATPTTIDAVSSEYRFKNGGDTVGLVGLASGGFEAAWIRAGEKEMQLWWTAFEAGAAPAKP